MTDAALDRIRELEKDNKAFLAWAQTFEAERDDALAAIRRVRELLDSRQVRGEGSIAATWGDAMTALRRALEGNN